MDKEEIYYKNLLNKYKKLTICHYSSVYLRGMVKDIIHSAKTDKRPVIVVSRYSDNLKERFGRDRLVIMNPKFSDIESLKGVDNYNKILVFKEEEKQHYECEEFVSNLEFAMLANKIMTKQGENPLIIIEDFQGLYLQYKYIESYNYFKEVFLDELSDEQNLVLMTLGIAPYGRVYEETADLFRIIRDTNAMVLAPNSLGSTCFGPFSTSTWGIQAILKNSEEDMSDMLKNFDEICTEETRLRKGLVFDFKEKTIEDFKGRPD